jgi:hypothetical protein
VSFTKRHLRYVIQLNNGGLNLSGGAPETFEDGSDRLTIEGLRSVASLLGVQGGATPFVSHAQIQLWGMKPADMAKLSTLGLDIARINKNTVQVFAYDDGNSANAAQVFAGTISNARLNYNAMPDVSLELECYGTFAQQTQAIAGTSVKGSGDVVAMLQGICAACDPPLKLVDNGISKKLSNPAHAYSAFDQINEICNAVGILYKIDGDTLTIWESGTNIDGVTINTGPGLGMVGYPEYNMMGFDVTMEFSRSVQLGRQLQILPSESPGALPIPGVPGTYWIWAVEHELSSEMPGGPWLTHARLAAHGTYPHS